MAALFTVLQWKCVLIASICHSEDDSTKSCCTSSPRRAGVRKEREIWEQESKKKVKPDLTASWSKHWTLDWLLVKDNRPRMSIIQPSCECMQAMQALRQCVKQTARARKRRDVFDAVNDSGHISLLWWNAARSEPHSTRYLPLKCSLAAIQIQQGCEKESASTGMLIFSFCLNSQRNVGIKWLDSLWGIKRNFISSTEVPLRQ